MSDLRATLDALQRCAPGAAVVVSAPGADPVDASRAEPEATESDDGGFTAMMLDAVRRDTEARAQLQEAVAKVEAAMATMTAMTGTIAEVMNLQRELIASTKELTETLARPQAPVYNDKGKLIGVKRVDKLGDES